MHLIGTQGMPRRVSDYDPIFAHWNMFISVASFFLGASTIVFLYNMVVSMRRGAPAPGNPWRALTLEWQVTSPPPVVQLRRDPAGRRESVRVRHSRRAPRRPQRRPYG
jgi:Heme/copper-type cytochrome/quinol oxidases, subunit 1